jgi:Trk-type K+ transport system membrane component
VLTARFAAAYDEPLHDALYLGVFHAVSAYNNAGFGLYSDSLMRFVADPWVCLPIAGAVIAGGLGFPVLFELRRQLGAPRRWSLHTKLATTMTAALLALGTVFITASEWTNPATLGALDGPSRLPAGFFHAVMPRTAGFNSLDIAQLHEGTWLGWTSSCSYAEVRGDPAVHVFDRRVDARAQRQALTVAVLAAGAVVCATLALADLRALPTEKVLFEAVFGVRDGRSVDRYHCRPAAARSGPADRAHVPRPPRPDHARLGDRAARAAASLSTPGRQADHWLGTSPAVPAAWSSSGWNASTGRSPGG